MPIAWLWSCRGAPTEVAPPPPPSPAVAVEIPAELAARYRLSFAEAARHRVAVEATIRCPGDGALELWMPSWTPGSYAIRDYARTIDHVDLGDQRLTPIAKDRWRGTCAAGQPATVTYTIWAWPGSVREDRVEPDLALLQGAATYLLPDGAEGRYEIALDLPPGWSVHTALPATADGWVARDLDTLIDSPIAAGLATVAPFEVRGVPHELVALSVRGTFDPEKAALDAARVAEGLAAFWGEVPYPRYQLLVWLEEPGGGGLEHRDSTLVTAARRYDEDYRPTFAELVAHEMGHAWDGKRLRPRGLGPFDYRREVYTPSLWVVEGVDSYVADLVVARAGLRTEEQALAALSGVIGSVQNAPGRADQTLAAASVAAWVGEYKRDSDSPNRQVSYYNKGEAVAWLLDAEIRRATDDRASLDDWLRLAWERIGDAPYDEADLRALASEVAHRDLEPFFAAAVDGTEELDYGGALQWWGLRWTEPGPVTGWLGATLDGAAVTEVRDGTPAAAAGLSVGDEILAIGGERPKSLADAIKGRAAGWTGPVLVARDGVVRELTVTLGTRPERTWTLEADPGASPIAARRRARWLGPR